LNRKQSLAATLETVVENAVSRAGIQDIHTHLVPPAFGDLLLWGIDELLTYHYLVAELFRVPSLPVTPEQFWTLKKSDQADLVWKHLFLHRSPVSEAARGVLTCLRYLGLDPDERDLADHRRFFADTTVEAHLDRVLEVSGVHTLVMTNDPFEEQERALWMQGGREDSRFRAALRIDPLLTFQEEAGAV